MRGFAVKQVVTIRISNSSKKNITQQCPNHVYSNGGVTPSANMFREYGGVNKKED